MIDNCQLWLPEAEYTVSSGRSLARTLYGVPLTILLHGDLGAGKTTFVQAFLKELGVGGHITSPTFALEQRYTAADNTPVLHIDLYRLKPEQAADLIAQSDSFPGIRCIEWAERLLAEPDGAVLRIDLKEKDHGRALTVEFDLLPLPDRQQIERWRSEVSLPAHIGAHCDAVSAFALHLAKQLNERGILVRTDLLRRAGEVHDLLRFIDFREGAAMVEEEISEADLHTWASWKARYTGMGHEQACAAFLVEQGYDALARVVEVHGLTLPSPERTTIEQKLLFYADKRMRLDTVVTLDERFEDFHKRYGQGKESAMGAVWYEEAAAIERELFPSLRGATE